MYGKVMSIPDELIIRYFELATELPKEEIRKIEQEMREGKLNPRDAKARLAREIVKIYHGEEASLKAEEEFNRIFRNKELPENVPEVEISEPKIWIVKLLTQVGAAKSNSEAKRLIFQGAVEIDGTRIEDINLDISIDKPFILRVGKHFFRRIKRA